MEINKFIRLELRVFRLNLKTPVSSLNFFNNFYLSPYTQGESLQSDNKKLYLFKCKIAFSKLYIIQKKITKN